MTIEQRKIHPEELSRLKENCIWLLNEKTNKTPSFIQLDWNMCGSLSRTRTSQKEHPRSLVPTLKRISPEYVMLEDDFTFDVFSKTCSGMKFENVAIICSNADSAQKIATQLTEKKESEYPKSVLVCIEEINSR